MDNLELVFISHLKILSSSSKLFWKCFIEMCWQRVVVRTGLLASILFVALSVPNFGSIMDFVGSTAIPFTCIILPTLFGLSLKSQRYNEKTKKWKIPTLKELVVPTVQLNPSNNWLTPSRIFIFYAYILYRYSRKNFVGNSLP